MSLASLQDLYPAEIIEKAAQIRLLALDVDGVLTPGEITYLSSGEEVKIFNAKDGQGLAMLRGAGILTAIVTARHSPVNQRRADELGITFVHQGIKKKLPVVERMAEEHGIPLSQVAYMGDDLPDLAVLQSVGLACCPADAVEEIVSVCHFVSRKDGGRGAVRELSDLLLRSRA